MKRSIMAAILFLSAFHAGASIYNLDFSNPSTFSTSCGNVVPAQWEVKNQNCNLTTSSIAVPGAPGVIKSNPVSLRINGTGNMEAGDYVKIEYSINGSWQIHDSIPGSSITSVMNYAFHVVCASSDVIAIRVTVKTDNSTEKVQIKSGDLSIGDPIDYADVLSVQLTSFTAEKNGNSVELRWTTEAEVNNDFFTLEKSADGIHFAAIAFIAGAGNSQQRKTYVHSDTEVNEGKSYYRLKQTDFDGLSTCSDVICFQVSAHAPKGFVVNSLSATGILNIKRLGPDASAMAEIMVCDLSGRVLFSTTTENAETSVQVDGYGSTGIFVVRVRTPFSDNSQKFFATR